MLSRFVSKFLEFQGNLWKKTQQMQRDRKSSDIWNGKTDSVRGEKES